MPYEPGGWLACTFCAPPRLKEGMHTHTMFQNQQAPSFPSRFPSTLKVGVIRSICLLASAAATGEGGTTWSICSLQDTGGQLFFSPPGSSDSEASKNAQPFQGDCNKTTLTLRIQTAAVLQQEINGKCSVRRSRCSHSSYRKSTVTALSVNKP